jgi:ABC-type glycerol-3-phosphate transport system substrate-binding protein
MGDRERIAEQLLAKQLSRRMVLKVGAAAPIGAALASLAGQGGRVLAQSPAAAPDYSGVTLQVWSGGTVAPPAEKAAAEWSAMTGGQVVVTVVPFGERALKFAGVISAQDPTVDLLYISGQFAGQFGDRLYEDLSAVDSSVYVPAIPPIFTSDGALRGLPVHSEMQIYLYNKAMFEAAGLDPDSPPDTWEGLYAAAPKLSEQGVSPCQVPWQVSFGSASFYLIFLNSIPGAKLLSDDRTQVLFGDENGLNAFKAIEAGMKAGFFDPTLAPDIEDYAIGGNFNNEKTASMINFAELWGYATGADPENFPTTILPENVGATILPGITSGTSGSVNGFEGFGINKYGLQKEAAMSFLQYLTGYDYQLQMNLSKVLPSSRVDVLTNPEVEAVYPVGQVLNAQGAYNLDRYASPYDWTPPVSDVLGKMYRGEITAEQAHEESVAKVNEIVLNYLAS